MERLLLLLAIGSCALADFPFAIPSPEQLAWSDLERGCIIHFNIYTYIPGAQAFAPTGLSTDNWIKACASYGGKYAVLVAKHSDGFTLWPSKSYEPLGFNYTIAHSPFKRDVVQMFIDSCQKYGVLPGIYCSASFNYLLNVSSGVTFGNVTQKQYNQVVITQLTELWSRYGNLTEIWFDGGVLPASEGGPDLAPILNKLQPGAVVFGAPVGARNPVRWVGTELGAAPVHAYLATTDMVSCCGSTNADPFGAQWCPAESDTTLMSEDNWFWYPNPPALRNITELVGVYLQTVGRSTNLLLDVAPNTTGILPQDAYEQYAAFGDVVQVLFHGDAIQETNGTVTVGVYLYLELNLIELEEDISMGQRIYYFAISALDHYNGTWVPVIADATIGHKRLLVLPTTYFTSSLRLELKAAWEGQGMLRKFAAKKIPNSRYLL